MSNESIESTPTPGISPRVLRVAVAVMLVAALGIRLWHLGVPPFDFHGSRQYQNANNARSFAVSWDGSASPETREIALNNRLIMEPPLLELATASLWTVTGREGLWFPRVLSIVLWLAGGWFLFRLARRNLSEWASLIALAVYWFAPFGIQGSRTFQPDPLMMFLLLLAFERIEAYHRNPATRGLVQCALAAAGAMLVKPTCAPLVAVFYLVLLLRRLGAKGLADKQAYLFGAISLAPSVVYYGLLLRGGAGSDLEEHSSRFFIASLPLSLSYWRGWLVMIGRVVGWLPFAAAAVSLGCFRRQAAGRLAGALFLAYGVYGLVFNYHIHTHDYYSLPLIPMTGIALGPLLEFVARFGGRWARRISGKQWVLGAAAALVLLAGLGLVLRKANVRGLGAGVKARLKESLLLVGLSEKFYAFLNPGYYKMDQQVADEQKIGEIVGHSARTLFLTPDHGQSLRFNGRLSGWAWPDQPTLHVERDLEGIELSAAERFQSKYQARSPEYFIVTEFGDYAAQPDLQKFLEAEGKVIAEEPNRYLVLRLEGATASH